MTKASEFTVRVGTQSYSFSSLKKAREFLRLYNASAKMTNSKPAKLA